MATIKNCHSPSGMGYSTSNLRNTNLTDCPSCKYGTLDPKNEHIMKCADCGKEFPIKKRDDSKTTTSPCLGLRTWVFGEENMKQKPDKAEAPILKHINQSPELLSLLYDIDLMPEQVKRGSIEHRQMLTIAIWHRNYYGPEIQ